MKTDIQKGDRVRWRSTDQRGTVRSVNPDGILVEWEDGRVRNYATDGDLHRIYVPWSQAEVRLQEQRDRELREYAASLPSQKP